MRFYQREGQGYPTTHQDTTKAFPITMSQAFSGKVAVVTGGGSGYGRGIVEKLKSAGAEVIIADISESAGSQTARDLNATFIRANVADRSDWCSILNVAIEKYGKLDIVVNNAGACYLKKPSEMVSESEFDMMMKVNLKALYFSVSVIVPHLLECGQRATFVNIASTSGIRPRPGLTWYCASKAAINNASNCLALEYASNGIRFNTVCPVFGLTSM